MKKKLTISFPIGEQEINSILKVVWLAFFMVAPLFYVLADEEQGRSLAEHTNERQLSIDADQVGKTVSGIVTDEDGNPVPGITVIIKGTTLGTVTDFDGKYSIEVPNESDILVFSFVGMTTQEISVSGESNISVKMLSDTELLEDVVVVGYGTQKKESVVGAITQAKGEALMQSGGVATVGEALQGKLPGVTTIYSNSTPGENEPQIYIRGQSSWNGSGQPLILVDGMERSMSDIDLNEIESISVLKDASATAVFGVKGGNGVILITTKRGQEGKAQLSVSGNVTFKFVSKLPEKVDAYDGILIANESIHRESIYTPTSWNDFIPTEIASRYRYRTNDLDQYVYPDVDWQDEILKDFATDSRLNLSVRGGTKKARYFANLSYQNVNDIFDAGAFPNGRGYEAGYNYDRFNYRSNLDFDITKTTKFSVNLSGFYGSQTKPKDDERVILFSLYQMAPNLLYPQYPDGAWGTYHSPEWSTSNPALQLSGKGSRQNNKFQVNSDFILVQNLDIITKGLSFKGKLSYDNSFSSSRVLNDSGSNGAYGNVINKYYTEDGEEVFLLSEGVNDFDFVVEPWTINPLTVSDGTRATRFNYELSLNYNRTFDKKHATSALLLFKREEYSRGSIIPNRQEDWVGRLTYNYDSRYFVDINGAYNGSSQFGSEYRFDFFPSAALGWVVSNESFMSDLNWLDKFKFKGSYGLVGSDNFGLSNRWGDQTQYGLGGNARLNSDNFGAVTSAYTFYYETLVGNPEIRWETATKSNIGVELSILENMFTLDFDYFNEKREDIFIRGTSRSVPDIFGADPPNANTGETEVKGYEFVFGTNHRLNNGLGLRGNFAITKAKDEVIAREDPALTPDYQKNAGFAIGTFRTSIPGDMLVSLDDLYSAIPLENGQVYRRTGYYNVMDYNGDGYFSSQYDNVPYGYTNRPEYTWTTSLNASFKGWSVTVDFYGTKNATRYYRTTNLKEQHHLYFEHSLPYWSLDNPEAAQVLQPWTLTQANTDYRASYFDASLVRLKTVELAYTLPKKVTTKWGIEHLRLFVNGNNLALWTDMPDDREFNGGNIAESSARGNYPNLRRVNVGFNLNF